MSTMTAQFVCIEHTGSTEFSTAKDLRDYLDSKYTETYHLVNHGKYIEVMCNNAKIAVVKRYGV